ncbi:MAG: type II toxin-antitoxin system RelE/ParE family toxin [Trueperaceae bacterium]|nr:type II toxin-antitoxin system RelE/ParE family toxin [Trueperaceae bacterium]
MKGSHLANLKELRPGSRSRSDVRILFAFDPSRQAILLAAGDKSGQWDKWYVEAIPIAEARFQRWLAGEYAEEL